MTTIAILIPVRNRIHHTRNILDQIKHLQSGDAVSDAKFDIVVIDDGSDDGTYDMVAREYPDAHLVRGNGHLWWTGAIVAGMKYAADRLNPRYYLWLNDDIVLDRHALTVVARFCRNYETAPLTGDAANANWNRLQPADSPETHGCRPIIGGIVFSNTITDWIAFGGHGSCGPVRRLEDFGDDALMAVQTINGNLAIVPQDVVDLIGLPDEKRFRHYGGDFEYCHRARKAGVPVLLSREMRACSDYDFDDVVRYLPFWIQFRLANGHRKKWKVIRGLTEIRTNYNIWHIVNLLHHDAVHIPRWRYWLYFGTQIGRLLTSATVSRSAIMKQINKDLLRERVPETIVPRILRHSGVEFGSSASD